MAEKPAGDDRPGVEHQVDELDKFRPAWASWKPLAWQIEDLQALMAWGQGVILDGWSIASDAEGWRIVVKGTKDGRKLVAFTGARTYADALEVLVYETEHGSLNWHTDKYR